MIMRLKINHFNIRVNINGFRYPCFFLKYNHFYEFVSSYILQIVEFKLLVLPYIGATNIR